MDKIIIFGTGTTAELAKFYFENDTDSEVVAFTVDRDYIFDQQFLGLPLVPWEEIVDYFSPNQYKLFNTVGYGQMNAIRELKYNEGKQKGYSYVNYISSGSTVLTKHIGENNFIMEGNIIQPFVRIGNNNIMFFSNGIGHHSVIGNHCSITSHVAVSGNVIIKDNCFIGSNSTIRNHITLGYKSLIGAASWISEDTEDYGVYVPPKAKKINKLSVDIKL